MRKFRLRQTLAIALCVAFGSAMANPTGATVVSGAALLSNPSSNVLQVVNTPGTIINWNGFSIAAGETTRFVQLNAQSAVGGNPSNILGTLQSNGRVFLINPNGIVFGGGSVVDVAGLIASTRDISNADFVAGNYRFTGSGSGTITLQSGARISTVNAGNGGQVWLFAKDVKQEAGSSITVPQGQVVLAAGTELSVAQSSLGNMVFNLTTDGSSTIETLGSIAADLRPVGLFADSITHGGTVNAGTRGVIAMNATTDLTLKDGSTTTAPDGNIALRGGSKLEVQPTAAITSDGSNGRISFESNNLLVYPSADVHSVDGTVEFYQYQPSQYAVSSQTLFFSNSRGWEMLLAGVIYRRQDGNYVLRGFTNGSRSVNETVLDATGSIVSGPTVVTTVSCGSDAGLAVRQRVPAGYYENSTYVMDSSLTPSRFRIAGGGSFEIGKTVTNGELNFFASNGTLVARIASPIWWAHEFAIPLSDGRIAVGIGQLMLAATGAQGALAAGNLTSRAAQVTARALVQALSSTVARGRDAQDREGAFAVADFGEMERYVAGAIEEAARMENQGRVLEAREKADAVNAFYQRWLERENLIQGSGLYRSDPREIQILNIIDSMNPMQRLVVFDTVTRRQSRGE